ncbi:MAG: carbon monoxide dehydrogenase subunit G, partial [Nitrososphaerota archaeon]|nr:carbon monoxide dehydrogenase subunit G [Nitrososphaerota archaeon]
HFDGTVDAMAPAAQVYAALIDPNQLSACIPGFQRAEVKSPREFTVLVKAGVSFIRGDFTIKFDLVEARAPTHAKLVGRGSGMGSVVDIEATMDISEAAGGGSSTRWYAEAKVGGKIASLGQRLLEGQAEKIIREMFACLRAKFEQG